MKNYYYGKPKPISKITRKAARVKLESTLVVFDKLFSDKKGASVLDIGCRDGYSVKNLSKRGYNVLGTDVENEYVDYCKKHGRNVVLDDILDTKILPGFDIIFSRHVIEHTSDAKKFLDVCYSLLYKVGSIFITFPLEKAQEGMSISGHMTYFETIEDFREIVEQTPFEIKILDYSKNHGILPMKNEVLFVGEK